MLRHGTERQTDGQMDIQTPPASAAHFIMPPSLRGGGIISSMNHRRFCFCVHGVWGKPTAGCRAKPAGSGLGGQVRARGVMDKAPWRWAVQNILHFRAVWGGFVENFHLQVQILLGATQPLNFFSGCIPIQEVGGRTRRGHPGVSYISRIKTISIRTEQFVAGPWSVMVSCDGAWRRTDYSQRVSLESFYLVDNTSLITRYSIYLCTVQLFMNSSTLSQPTYFREDS